MSKNILDYITQVGCFTPPQYYGGYDNVPFTHEDYLNFVGGLSIDNAEDHSVEGDEQKRIAPATIKTLHFVDSQGRCFVLRHLEMGEDIDQLMTKKFYEENFLKINRGPE